MDLVGELKARGVTAELVRTGAEMHTVAAAAQALGTSETAIVKSLLFEAKDGRVVLVVVGGPSRVDMSKVAELAGFDGLRLARPHVVLEKTGYPVGGVPPVLHKEKFPVLVDRQVLEQEVVYGGGGKPELLLRIAPQDIVALTGAKVCDVTAE